MKSIVIICFLCTVFLFSEEDSSKVFLMQDVVVTGTRGSVDIAHLSTTVHVLDSMDLVRSNGATLGDQLQHFGGVSMRKYGGNGALQSVSFRGLGSDYSLIMIDGQRFTSFQISTVDVGIIPVNEIARIEIAPGGNSSRYGSDAVGGVINIVTKRPNGERFLTVSQTTGSFGLTGFSATAGGGNSDNSFRVGIELRRASNNFDFRFDDGAVRQVLRRAGADYSMKNVSISSRNVVTDQIESRSTIRYSIADRGQPSAVTTMVQNNAGRINDRDLFFNSVTDVIFPDAMNFSIPITYHTNRQSFFDPSIILYGYPVDTYYENNSFGTSPLIRYSFSQDHHLAAGAEVTIASITSNEVFPSRREQYSVYTSSEHYLLSDVILYPSVRFDSFSDTPGDLSPKLGINIGVWNEPSIRVRASYGKNFRVPTFNDLYWIRGGNPALAPERSLNLDIGVVAGIRYSDLHANVELNYFSIAARNKIVWQPVSGTLWSPVNLQSVTSKGFEGRFTMHAWNDLLIVGYAHNFVNARKTSEDLPGDAASGKLLPHVPKEFSSFSIGSLWEGLSVNLTYSFTGFRFETSDNNPRFFLPAYDNIDANISYGLTVSGIALRLRGEVNNLANTDQLLLRGYPMPLRQYSFITTVSL